MNAGCTMAGARDPCGTLVSSENSGFFKLTLVINALALGARSIPEVLQIHPVFKRYVIKMYKFEAYVNIIKVQD